MGREIGEEFYIYTEERFQADRSPWRVLYRVIGHSTGEYGQSLDTIEPVCIERYRGAATEVCFADIREEEGRVVVDRGRTIFHGGKWEEVQ